MSAPEAMVKARMALQSGDHAGALDVLETARKAHPEDSSLADATGDLSLKLGKVDNAVAHFADAARLAPQVLDFALNHVIALQRQERHADALAVLKPREREGRDVAKYGSVRALSERALGNLAEAARWYDRVLAIEPRHPRAMHGRARVALERCEDGAVQRFDNAIGVTPGDGDLWLGKAQALDIAGDHQGALKIARQIATQAPSYLPGQSFYAQMRLAVGDTDFTSHYADAAKKHPTDPNIPAAHCDTLSGLDYAAEAAAVAADARKRFPDQPHFALLEAVHAGAAGDWVRAEAIFASLKDNRGERFLHEARHRLRAGEPQRADEALEQVLASDPWSIGAWALRGIAWRMMDDERAQWLHGQKGLVQSVPLAGAADLLPRVVDFLRPLHEKSALPLGQSLRGGTQTRGVLFQRDDAVLQELQSAILTTLEDYRSKLPAHDATHPLLRHHDRKWNLAGSWSVRLEGGDGRAKSDFHTSHIHPQGMLSSALYLVVPDEAADESQRNGWLEIGRPPPDLGLDLEPQRQIQPEAGQLALFPSTLYHGTTPFSGQERMTVAFDVVTKED